MKTKSLLKRADWEDFLVYLYFGPEGTYLLRCIDLAYLDLNRTLHGMGRLPSKIALRARVRKEMKRRLTALASTHSPVTNQRSFDRWHCAVCERLSLLYEQDGYHQFYVGQGQKYVNMTLKYVFCLGENRLPGYQKVYRFAHVPLDNILLAALKQYGVPALSCAWSRLDDYSEYLRFQKWVRRHFSVLPMDVECRLWLGQALPAGAVRQQIK